MRGQEKLAAKKALTSVKAKKFSKRFITYFKDTQQFMGVFPTMIDLGHLLWIQKGIIHKKVAKGDKAIYGWENTLQFLCTLKVISYKPFCLSRYQSFKSLVILALNFFTPKMFLLNFLSAINTVATCESS